MSSTKDGARARRKPTRAAITTTAAALVAAAAFAGPANANLTLGPDDPDTGFPSFAADAAGTKALLCLGPAQPCGIPAAPTAAEVQQADGEAFYWSGTVSVPMADGDIAIAWDVEAATGPAPDAIRTTFQRVQIGSKDTNKLPDGEYTVTSPFGTFTATRTPGKPNNWRRIESTSAADGPIDHFLENVAAPAGYYGDANLDPGPIVGGALAGTVTVQAPSSDPLVAGEIGSTADWTIMGRKDGTAVLPPPPPADGDGDGVPNNQDLCPSDPGPASNRGCPVPDPQPPKSAGGGTAGGGTAAPTTAGTTTTTIIQVIPGPSQGVLGVQSSAPLSVSRLTLVRRISVTRLRAHGLRATMNVEEGTNVVRLSIYKARNGVKTGRALYSTVRTPTKAGLFRVSLRSSKLAKLRRGKYVIEVRAGRSAASLGAVKKFAFTVTK